MVKATSTVRTGPRTQVSCCWVLPLKDLLTPHLYTSVMLWRNDQNITSTPIQLPHAVFAMPVRGMTQPHPCSSTRSATIS